MRTGRYEVQRPQHLLEAAHHERMMQVELLKASQGIVHLDFLEAKTRIVIAREFGELPELDPKTRQEQVGLIDRITYKFHGEGMSVRVRNDRVGER